MSSAASPASTACRARSAGMPSRRPTSRRCAATRCASSCSPDGTVLCEEDEPDAALASLAEAMEQRLSAPFRAEAVRRGPAQWAVAASRIAIVRVPGLARRRGRARRRRASGRVLKVDGAPRFGSAPALEQVGEAEGPEYVVRARRLEGDLWEVEASPFVGIGAHPVPCPHVPGPRLARKGTSLRRKPAAQAHRRAGRVRRDVRGRLPQAERRRAAREDGRVQAAARERRDARGAALRGIRRGARGAPARVRPAHLRRADDGRHRPARGRHRRDEDRRGQDVRREPRRST